MSGASSNCWAIKWLRPLGWHQNDAGVHAFDRYPTRLRRNDRADALARWLDERPPVSGVLPGNYLSGVQLLISSPYFLDYVLPCCMSLPELIISLLAHFESGFVPMQAKYNQR